MDAAVSQSVAGKKEAQRSSSFHVSHVGAMHHGCDPQPQQQRRRVCHHMVLKERLCA